MEKLKTIMKQKNIPNFKELYKFLQRTKKIIKKKKLAQARHAAAGNATRVNS